MSYLPPGAWAAWLQRPHAVHHPPRRIARHRARKAETDAATAAWLAAALLDRYSDAARILAREVPSELAPLIIEELQRRLAEADRSP